MELLEGGGELLLACREEADGICILRCVSSGGTVVLPEEIRGLPVTSLGPYALSIREPRLEAVDIFWVRMTCGGPEPVHDAAAVSRAALPSTLRRLGDYAFYGCRGPRSRSLPDGTALGREPFMNCSALDRLELTSRPGVRTSLRALLAECTGDVEVALRLPGGEEARLFFPGYAESLELLAAPHIFQTRIQGGGYAFRQCFQDGALRFDQYDGCLSRLLEAHDFSAACRVALRRLRWPVSLSAPAEERYRQVLSLHGELAAGLLLEERDGEGLAFLLSLHILSPAALTAACDRARQLGDAGALAPLLEAQRSTGGRGLDKSFDL